MTTIRIELPDATAKAAHDAALLTSQRSTRCLWTRSDAGRRWTRA